MANRPNAPQSGGQQDQPQQSGTSGTQQVSVTFDCPAPDPARGMQAVDWSAVLNAVKGPLLQLLLAILQGGGNPPVGQQPAPPSGR